MIFFIVWVILALLVGSVGKNRSIGFGGAFILSLILSPLIGLIIVLLSSETTPKYKVHKYKDYLENAKKHEYKGELEQAIDNYTNALFHLENDYKGKNLNNATERKRKSLIYEARGQIIELKDKIQKTNSMKEVNNLRENIIRSSMIEQLIEGLSSVLKHDDYREFKNELSEFQNDAYYNNHIDNEHTKCIDFIHCLDEDSRKTLLYKRLVDEGSSFFQNWRCQIGSSKYSSFILQQRIALHNKTYHL